MKKINVFWNGKKLRDIYPHATWFEVLKWRVKKFLRKMTIASVAGLVIWMSVLAGQEFFPKTVYAVKEKEVIVDNLGKKIDEIRAEALVGIKQCESQGHSEEDGIIIFDSNNEASIGQYQFQRDTVIHYYKVLYGQVITRKEAVLIALDDSKAKKLAYDVIYTTDKGWRNWYNCSKKIGMESTLALISKLEN